MVYYSDIKGNQKNSTFAEYKLHFGNLNKFSCVQFIP